ncbi:MAG: enoyl-CoA hydratase/isomerase family protein [Hyphomicrobiales bacterium]|nr:enoyl-CoA hydratase/isomerase family protein [Hyphomicrobiales bacterium]
MPYSTLAVRQENAVAIIGLRRPARRNALNREALGDLESVLTALRDDESVKAVILTGDETAFCSGQDIKEPEPPDYLDAFNSVMTQIENFPKPTVAAIAGWCIAGGLEMAICCDQRVAVSEAKIGDFHVRINSIGGGGATARLPRLIGMAKAKRLIYTGEIVDGETALALGLVDWVCQSGEQVTIASALAEKMVPSDPRTFSYAKRSMHECIEMPIAEAVDRSVALQRELQARINAAH